MPSSPTHVSPGKSQAPVPRMIGPTLISGTAATAVSPVQFWCSSYYFFRSFQYQSILQRYQCVCKKNSNWNQALSLNLTYMKLQLLRMYKTGPYLHCGHFRKLMPWYGNVRLIWKSELLYKEEFFIEMLCLLSKLDTDIRTAEWGFNLSTYLKLCTSSYHEGIILSKRSALFFPSVNFKKNDVWNAVQGI